MADREAMKEKIAKLMAMANDGRGNEFEAEAALRQAEKLMRKHGIDAALLQDRTGEKPIYKWATILVPARPVRPIATSPTWFGFLITGIGTFTDTKVTLQRHPQHGMCAEFSGDEMDVEYAVYLCKHLRDEARRKSAEFGGTRADNESFRKAYAIRVQQRMYALVAERQAALRAVPTKTGTALVVVNTKIALRDAHFGAPTPAKTTRVNLRPTASVAGRQAGDKAGFGRPIGAPQNRKALT